MPRIPQEACYLSFGYHGDRSAPVLPEPVKEEVTSGLPRVCLTRFSGRAG